MREASLLFRELDSGFKDSTWEPDGFDIPGTDHVALLFNNRSNTLGRTVYESHPIQGGEYTNAAGEEKVIAGVIFGVQADLTKGTFLNYSDVEGHTKSVNEVAIDYALANKIAENIESKIETNGFNLIDLRRSEDGNLLLKPLMTSLHPDNQKGGGGTLILNAPRRSVVGR